MYEYAMRINCKINYTRLHMQTSPVGVEKGIKKNPTQYRLFQSGFDCQRSAARCCDGGVVVPDSTSPGFVRIWDRDGSGPRFVPVQDSPLLLT